ncbi:CsbD family protein [Gordonia sp. HY002]|uniref:CsbD family protein n=1 Tax=Gordonia zhenghanii TaxID=2911516 RepID=UPI001EF0F99D|nr:CsbD family protein [Gordonia zhenghanii]MCF8571485.1 CsbD family protein [Gordonia zhenghanii]MCF8608110.1 CsbD family protein [Gordonia zhenghanii]MCF8608119.1 CsbD family protein [Gordonia zhenghanii]
MGIADDAQNKADDLKGRAKEAAGAATNNDDLKNEGQADQGLAGAREKVTEAADKAKDGIDSLKNKLSGR